MFYQYPAAVFGFGIVFIIFSPRYGIPVRTGYDFLAIGSSVPGIVPDFIGTVQHVSVSVIHGENNIFLI